MHFHVAGLNIPYRVQYVAMAGGNAFYLKTDSAAAISPPYAIDPRRIMSC
jgi:hypothetical protein